MKILGRVNEWKIGSDEFTIGTLIGDIKIITKGCPDMDIVLLQAMKDRKQVIIEVVEP